MSTPLWTIRDASTGRLPAMGDPSRQAWADPALPPGACRAIPHQIRALSRRHWLPRRLHCLASRELSEFRMRRFPRLRRLAALLSGAFLVQLSLPAGASPCRMHGGRATAGPARMTHAHAARDAQAMRDPPQHVERGAAVATLSRADASTPGANATSCDCGTTRNPCGNPATSGACTTMGGCTAATAPLPGAPTLLATIDDAVRQLALPDVMPPGPAYAPESPPPRT